MSSRKRRRTGDVSTIEPPAPITNITPVNQRTPIQTPTGASAERISRPVTKEEKVEVILEHLREWHWSFSDLSLAWLQFGDDKRRGIKNDEAQKKKKAKKKKAKQLTATLLKDEEIRNAIMETADIHLELVNMVMNILHKELCDL